MQILPELVENRYYPKKNILNIIFVLSKIRILKPEPKYFCSPENRTETKPEKMYNGFGP